MRKKTVQSGIARSFQNAAPYLSVVYAFFGSIIFFGYLGYLADEKWHQKPLFLITGVFLGFALGFYRMIKLITEQENTKKK